MRYAKSIDDQVSNIYWNDYSSPHFLTFSGHKWNGRQIVLKPEGSGACTPLKCSRGAMYIATKVGLPTTYTWYGVKETIKHTFSPSGIHRRYKV